MLKKHAKILTVEPCARRERSLIEIPLVFQSSYLEPFKSLQNFAAHSHSVRMAHDDRGSEMSIFKVLFVCGENEKIHVYADFSISNFSV